MNENSKTLGKFSYHPILIRMYWILFWALIISELAIIRVNIFKILDGSWYHGVSMLLLASTVPISIFIRLYFVFRPRIFSKYELFSDKVIISFKEKEKEFQFSQIKSLKLSLLPPRFFGGFSLILKSGQKFVFLSFLENSYLIFRQIYRQNPSLIGAAEYERFVFLSQIVDASWRRIRSRFSDWKILLIFYLLIPFLGFGAIALGFHKEGVVMVGPLAFDYLSLFGIFILLGVGLGGTVNYFEENWLNGKQFVKKKAGKQVEKPVKLRESTSLDDKEEQSLVDIEKLGPMNFDEKLEKKAHRIFSFLYVFIYFSIVLALYFMCKAMES